MITTLTKQIKVITIKKEVLEIHQIKKVLISLNQKRKEGDH
jgi:hypothetical protein